MSIVWQNGPTWKTETAANANKQRKNKTKYSYNGTFKFDLAIVQLNIKIHRNVFSLGVWWRFRRARRSHTRACDARSTDLHKVIAKHDWFRRRPEANLQCPTVHNSENSPPGIQLATLGTSIYHTDEVANVGSILGKRSKSQMSWVVYGAPEIYHSPNGYLKIILRKSKIISKRLFDKSAWDIEIAVRIRWIYKQR